MTCPFGLDLFADVRCRFCRYPFVHIFDFPFQRVHMTELQPRSLGDWFSAMRPWSFPASTMPVLLSLAYYLQAGVSINPVTALWALVNIVIFHAAGNVWSDYFDYKRGVDAKDTHGVRVLAHGKFTAQEFLIFSLALFALGSLCAIFLVVQTGFPFVWITLIGIAAALLYPPLKYCAWGDVVIFVAYTLTPMYAMSWIVTGTWSAEALPAQLPTGILTVAILHANNLRDIPTDLRAGIKTLASVLGVHRALRLYQTELALPLIIVIGCICLKWLPWGSLLTLVTLAPLSAAWKTASLIQTQGHDALSRLDEMTAKLQLLFSLLMVVGLVVSYWVGF